MEFNFRLPIKAFSVNSYYYKNRAMKTKEAREYEQLVLAHLGESAKGLLALADKWRISGGVFHIAICNNYPATIFYNRHGQISAKTFDVSNIEKPLLDLIFIHYMGVDDKHVVAMKSCKQVGSIGIDIAVELILP